MKTLPVIQHPPVNNFEVTNSMHLTGNPYIFRESVSAPEVLKYTFSTWMKTDSSLPLSSQYKVLFGSYYVRSFYVRHEAMYYKPDNGEFRYLDQSPNKAADVIFNAGPMNEDSWFHFCFRWDYATLSLIVEINGVVSGIFEVYPMYHAAESYMGGHPDINATVTAYIGRLVTSAESPAISCYVADTHLVIGELYDSSYFRDENNKPKAFTEDHGLNGAYLTYKDANNLGKNEVGEDWTSVYDPQQSTDIPS